LRAQQEERGAEREASDAAEAAGVAAAETAGVEGAAVVDAGAAAAAARAPAEEAAALVYTAFEVEYAAKASDNLLAAWGLEEGKMVRDDVALEELWKEFNFLQHQITGERLLHLSDDNAVAPHNAAASRALADIRRLDPKIGRCAPTLVAILYGWHYLAEITKAGLELEAREMAAGTLQGANKNHQKRRRAAAATKIESAARGWLARAKFNLLRAEGLLPKPVDETEVEAEGRVAALRVRTLDGEAQAVVVGEEEEEGAYIFGTDVAEARAEDEAKAVALEGTRGALEGPEEEEEAFPSLFGNASCSDMYMDKEDVPLLRPKPRAAKWAAARELPAEPPAEPFESPAKTAAEHVPDLKATGKFAEPIAEAAADSVHSGEDDGEVAVVLDAAEDPLGAVTVLARVTRYRA